MIPFLPDFKVLSTFDKGSCRCFDYVASLDHYDRAVFDPTPPLLEFGFIILDPPVTAIFIFKSLYQFFEA